MTYSATVHVAIYRVLDDVLASSATPPGAKAEIHSIIDDLRSTSAAREMVAMAEGISLLIHQLESALSQGNRTAESNARKGLKGIAAEWLNFRLQN